MLEGGTLGRGRRVANRVRRQFLEPVAATGLTAEAAKKREQAMAHGVRSAARPGYLFSTAATASASVR